MDAPGLFLVGRRHTIEFEFDDEDGGVHARCRGAQASFQNGKNWCYWVERYDDLNDATEYAKDHADELRS